MQSIGKHVLSNQTTSVLPGYGDFKSPKSKDSQSFLHLMNELEEEIRETKKEI